MLKIRTILHGGEEWTVPINADDLQLTHAVFLSPNITDRPTLTAWYSRITGMTFDAFSGRGDTPVTWVAPIEFVEISPDLDPGYDDDLDDDQLPRAA
jgi:hypothetical protein